MVTDIETLVFFEEIFMAIIKGNKKANKLKGKSAADKIYGYAGNDTLYGYAGNDKLYGGDGHDKLYGGNGNDLLEGENGNDRLDGGYGNDILKGGNGDDYLFGGLSGKDTLYGGKGRDKFAFDTPTGKLNVKIMDFEKGKDKIDMTPNIHSLYDDYKGKYELGEIADMLINTISRYTESTKTGSVYFNPQDNVRVEVITTNHTAITFSDFIL